MFSVIILYTCYGCQCRMRNLFVLHEENLSQHCKNELSPTGTFVLIDFKFSISFCLRLRNTEKITHFRIGFCVKGRNNGFPLAFHQNFAIIVDAL